MEMKIGKRGVKLLGMLFIMVALAFFMVSILRDSSLAIQDNDPTSYSVVVLLMLFPFLLFGMKERLKFSPGMRNVAYGLAIFVLFAVLFSYLSASLSFSFHTFGAFAIALPLLLASLIVTIFGVDGVIKLKTQIVYSLFAAPLLLEPVIRLNNVFVNFNAEIIYDLLKTLGLPLYKNGITIIAPSAFGISIASTCAAIGAFIALVMFLVPIAYLYEGDIGKKVLWIICGVVLMFFLNVARMLSISLIWAYYGISSALTVYHLFIGQILFYIAIVMMFIIGLKWNLGIGKIKKAKREAVVHLESVACLSFAVVIVLGGLSFALASQYSNYITAPLFLFGSNNKVGNVTAYATEVTLLENVHMNISGLKAVSNGYLFELVNGTYRSSNPIFVSANITNSSIRSGRISEFSILSPSGVIILRDGITIYGYKAESEGGYFHVDLFSVPVLIGNSYYSINYEFFLPYSEFQNCTDAQTGMVNQIEAAVYNLITFGSLKGSYTCAAYLTASSAG
jgi:exosortase/archaeosortase family protein